MTFLLPLLFIISISGTMALFWKQRFEIVLPLSLLFTTLIVFIAALCNQMQLGFILVILFALVFPVWIGIHLATKKRLLLNTTNFFTPGFFIFLVLYTFIFLLNYDRGFMVWDEVSHWGIMVKEMLRLDKLYSVAESALSVHKDYPPAVALFETIWCKICGGYKEAYLYRSLQVLMLSLLFPALSKLNWKKTPAFMVKLFLIFITVLSAAVVIQVGEASFYRTIYIDCFLGLLFAYCLFLIIYEQKISKFSVFQLSVALSFLLLTKQMGLVLFLLILFAFIVNYFVTNPRQGKHLEGRKRTIKTIWPYAATFLSLAVIPYLCSFIWNKYILLHDLPRQFNISSISFTQLLGIAKGTAGEAYQHEALVNFVKAMVNSVLVGRPLALTYWQLMLVSVIVFFLIGKFGRDYFQKHQIATLNVVVFLGALGYAAALMLLYIFCFGPYEGPNLASFTRYTLTYWLGVFVLAIMLFLYVECNKENDTKRTRLSCAGIIIVFLWLAVFDAGTAHNFVPAIHYNSVTSIYSEDARIIETDTEATSSVCVISQNSDGFVNYSLQYLTAPRSCNRFNFSLGEPYDENDRFTVNITAEEWQTFLRDWDYLYLQNVDAQFTSKYQSIFPAESEIESRQLYKIENQSDGSLVLQLIQEDE